MTTDTDAWPHKTPDDAPEARWRSIASDFLVQWCGSTDEFAIKLGALPSLNDRAGMTLEDRTKMVNEKLNFLLRREAAMSYALSKILHKLADAEEQAEAQKAP